jgi:hypothetical protein
MVDRTRRVRQLLTVAAMLLATAALSLPVCAFGFCETCTQQCRNESFSVYNQCRDGGGSVSYCDSQMEQYNENCQAMFCPSCPFLPN